MPTSRAITRQLQETRQDRRGVGKGSAREIISGNRRAAIKAAAAGHRFTSRPPAGTMRDNKEALRAMSPDSAGRRSPVSTQNIPIGVLCPSEMAAKMEELLRDFPSFQPVLKPYAQADDIVELAGSLIGEVEVILFTEHYAYRLAGDRIRFPVPAQVVPMTGSGLYRALFRVHKQYGLRPLSMDSIPEKASRHLMREFGLEERRVFLFDGPSRPSVDDLVKFHRRHFERDQSVAVTGAAEAARRLSALGIPCVWATPSDYDIIVSLERALLSTETRKMRESQIVVAFILVDHFDKLENRQSSEHELQRLKLDVYRHLLDYADSMQGYLTSLDGSQYLLVTTRGVLERETGGYKSIPIAKEIKANFQLTLSIGIGFGRSASEAGNHARSALRHAVSAGGNSCFIVREDGGLIGPLEMGDSLEYNLSLLSPDVLKKAEQAGLNTAYLSRLASQIAKKGKTDYHAHELAFIFGVTTRSAHRMLMKWVDAGLAEIVGIHPSGTRGRPKQIYRLTFMEDIVKRR